MTKRSLLGFKKSLCDQGLLVHDNFNSLQKQISFFSTLCISDRGHNQMAKLPTVESNKVIKALEKAGFQVVRQKGSHVRMKHEDGRVVTIPVHKGKNLGKGLLKKILRDTELTVDEFIDLLGT
jgi:predicted RNA binding protein YcfA (HicA-like mRNA interferase family)